MESSRKRVGTGAALAVGSNSGLALFLSHPLAKKIAVWTVAAAAVTTDAAAGHLS